MENTLRLLFNIAQTHLYRIFDNTTRYQRSKQLLLLFFWPRARAVWPNNEVVMFQTQSGTALSLVSVVNVTSELKPRLTVQLFTGSFPVNLHVLTPPSPYPHPSSILHPETELHLYFYTRLYPFSSGLGLPVHSVNSLMKFLKNGILIVLGT